MEEVMDKTELEKFNELKEKNKWDINLNMFL